ncbi:hypothetical protein NHQ30_011307 [Ciborinia camelliae]|nr:hypothetical protein NHQ30_011307 [Ciborinia camelliae]
MNSPPESTKQTPQNDSQHEAVRPHTATPANDKPSSSTQTTNKGDDHSTPEQLTCRMPYQGDESSRASGCELSEADQIIQSFFKNESPCANKDSTGCPGKASGESGPNKLCLTFYGHPKYHPEEFRMMQGARMAEMPEMEKK